MPPVGHSPGGSARVASPTYDFVASSNIDLTTALSDDREVGYDCGLPVLLLELQAAPHLQPTPTPGSTGRQ